jgi:hypothetical protein
MTFRTSSEPPVEGNPSEMLQPTAEGSQTQVPAETVLAAGWTQTQWAQAVQQSYSSSVTWFESSVLRGLARNVAHFQSRHAPGSKYLTEFYRLRSQTFRPKTRSMVRRSEAALAVALFSTADLLDTQAWDDTNPDQQDAAEVGKGILQYRMEHTRLYWFQTMVGAMQEADVNGLVVGHIHWQYTTRERQELQVVDEQTQAVDWRTVKEVTMDEPRVDLCALENCHIDPAADWRDPINRSPYFFHREPMYVGDLKQMMKDRNGEMGETWYFEIDDAAWWRYAGKSNSSEDTLRRARDAGQQDPMDMQRGVPDFEMVWVTHCYMRVNGTDYFHDMLDTETMLSIPRPVEEVFPHLPVGIRPYVAGTAAIEVGKIIPTSPVGMVEETQREINELANLTQDGLRMAVLNRWIARRGASLDVETLKYGAANSVIVADDINQDVRELRAADVPSTVFAAGDRLSNTFDEMAGTFSQSSVASQRALNQTVGGMEMLQGDASSVREYEIRTLCETFVDPVINHLLWMEQTYETDEELLHDVCTRTGLSLDRVLDVLGRRVPVRTNVGFGATSPEQRIKRLQMGVSTVTELAPESGTDFNVGEIVKEVFGALGYKNGARFYDPNGRNQAQSPEMQKLAQENAQLKAQLAGKQTEANARVQAASITANARLRHAAMDSQTRQAIAQMTADLKAKELQLQSVDRQLATTQTQIDQARLANERDALSNEIQTERVKLMAELAKIQHDTRAQATDQLASGRSGPPFNVDPSASGELSRNRFGLIPFEQG